MVDGTPIYITHTHTHTQNTCNIIHHIIVIIFYDQAGKGNEVSQFEILLLLIDTFVHVFVGQELHNS